MKRFIPSLPVIIIAAFVLLIGILNFDQGTLLTGGDNLHPEFNFALNIKRSLFAVWQEYQGVGLLGGMGHASDLLRQLFLLPFSLILPLEALRYCWAYLTLFLGTLGAYYLIRTILTTYHFKAISSATLGASSLTKNLLTAPHFALLGSLFYLLNLATVQTYYTPFEVFMAHFAALPWLLLTTYWFSRLPSKKHFWYLILTLVLSTPQGYVPTLFVVSVIAITVISLFSRPIALTMTWTKNTVISLLKLYGLIVVINAFWLLPFAYFTLTSASVNVNAKINQMATEMIFQQNREVGSLTDVMLLKGFWLNNVEPNLKGVSTYMLLPWRDHLAHPIILTIGYLFFAVILLGVYTSLRTKKWLGLGFVVLFLFSVVMLTTATPPFSWINAGLREFVPLFNQVFRFPFTKFSLLAGLTYAVFFAIGAQSLAIKSKRFSFMPTAVLPILIFSLLLFSWPTFRGHLFYERETIALPQEYKDTFAFFAGQDKTTRIANFPQQTYWGWNFYRWGYSGSGFLWYGIEQPILDRAFDVWNPYSENYYFEAAEALYAKDSQSFLQVMQKYDVSWLLVDKNITYPTSPKSLFLNELGTIIKDTPEISLARKFGNIEIYRIAKATPSRSFVTTATNVPTVNAYTWNNNDLVYKSLGTYIATENDPTYVYPFRSFFSQKTDNEEEYSLQEEDTALVLRETLPASSAKRTLILPEMAQSEYIIPATITTQIASNGALIVSATVHSPEVWLDDKRLSGEEAQIRLFTIPAGRTTYPLTLNNSGVVNIKITKETKAITTTFLSLRQDNIFSLNEQTGLPVDRITIATNTVSTLPTLAKKSIVLSGDNKEHEIKIIIPKITDNYANFTPSLATKPSVSNCDYFRNGQVSVQSIKEETHAFLELAATNATACISYYAPYLSHDYGYAVFIKHKNSSGRDLHFWLLNEDEGYSPIDTYILGNNIEQTTSFVLPPQEKFGNAYSLHFDSISIGDTRSHNSISHVSIHPLPYTYLTHIRVMKEDVSEQPDQDFQTPETVSHPNESLYVVSGIPPATTSATLILSQSYAPGWHAYNVSENSFLTRYLPFVFGAKITNHVKVNNWENGWVLIPSQQSKNSSIVIVYLPQYLEYLGFVLPLLIVPFFLPKSRLFRLKRNA